VSTAAFFLGHLWHLYLNQSVYTASVGVGSPATQCEEI
jgi:hypothetical protein